ncbi:MAG: type IV pilin, partial [Halococcoides sp.]
AVIATFVLGLGSQLQTTAPQASFTTQYDQPNTNLTITHSSGESIKASNLYVTGSGVNNSTMSWTAAGGNSSDVTAGDSITLTDVNKSESVRLVWRSPEGDSSSTLVTWTGPEA